MLLVDEHCPERADCEREEGVPHVGAGLGDELFRQVLQEG